MYQLEKTQLDIIVKNMSGTITNSRLSLIHTKENTTWLWRWIFLRRVVSGIRLVKARREWGQASLFDRQSPCYWFGSMRTITTFFRLWRLLEISLQRRWASFYRWRKGSWDPYNHGIGPILKEASMRGGKPLPLHGDPKPNHQNQIRYQFMDSLGQNFRHLFFKNTP